jgi:hypothetical protein
MVLVRQLYLRVYSAADLQTDNTVGAQTALDFAAAAANAEGAKVPGLWLRIQG